MNFRASMSSLRTLSNDYYQNRISLLQYREQRSQLLRLIDEDLNGIKIIEQVKTKKDESIIEKVLSFLKIDKLNETN
ncbi:MAG: hypothetical protein KAT06_03130 [Gammaproteobacteria bacterium]|nr:hypothetical protein [Gammaproteobacteria bacterium]